MGLLTTEQGEELGVCQARLPQVSCFLLRASRKPAR